jgi:macrolide phosphotransferase
MPGLEVANTQDFTGGGNGDFDAALVSDRVGRHFVLRAPTSPRAAALLADEAVALRALTTGVRTRLPFEVPTVRGTAALPDRHGTALLTDYVPGSRLRLASVQAGSNLAASIGEVLAAIHTLFTSVVADAGLPVETSLDCVRGVAGLVDRAAATGRVPDALVARWEAALADASVWQFTPTVIHGSLTADVLLSAPRGEPNEEIIGVLAWSGLRVGDPARDLGWTLALPGDAAAASVLEAYNHFRRGAVDGGLRQRAMLYAELDLARWLLHGVDSGQQDIVEDATEMLETLRRSVHERTAGSLQHETVPVLSLDEVERLIASHRSVLGSTTPDHSSRSSSSE